MPDLAWIGESLQDIEEFAIKNKLFGFAESIRMAHRALSSEIGFGKDPKQGRLAHFETLPTTESRAPNIFACDILEFPHRNQSRSTI